MYCVNVIKNINERCDCAPQSRIVAKDVGCLDGNDPLKIDIETARLLKASGANLNWEKWDKFETISSYILK